MQESKRLEVQAARAHRLYLLGLVAGFIIGAGMLVGAVVLGTAGQPWLSAMFAGPSLLALVTIFVLRRNDGAQAKAVERASRAAANTAGQPAPAQPQAPAAP
ncbi:hypothetical protein [Streptomyces sp. URMC 129]|uniref:hypothetical protein n=1 Tax=Streptomyces sp. URMC 129 TaxID=3423407 RepID=UPI003F52B054